MSVDPDPCASFWSNLIPILNGLTPAVRKEKKRLSKIFHILNWCNLVFIRIETNDLHIWVGKNLSIFSLFVTKEIVMKNSKLKFSEYVYAKY